MIISKDSYCVGEWLHMKAIEKIAQETGRTIEDIKENDCPLIHNLDVRICEEECEICWDELVVELEE